MLLIMRGTGVIPDPGPDLALQAADKLLALGTVAQLEKMEAVMAAGGTG